MKISSSSRRRKGRGRKRRSRRRLDWEIVWLVLVVVMVMVVGPLSVPPNLRHWARPDQQRRRKPPPGLFRKSMYDNSNRNNRSLSRLCTVSGTRR